MRGLDSCDIIQTCGVAPCLFGSLLTHVPIWYFSQGNSMFLMVIETKFDIKYMPLEIGSGDELGAIIIFFPLLDWILQQILLIQTISHGDFTFG